MVPSALRVRAICSVPADCEGTVANGSAPALMVNARPALSSPAFTALVVMLLSVGLAAT